VASTDKLQAELSKAARLTDRAERGVAIAAVIAEALRGVGQDPVLVGGAAVEYYTQGGYTTADIDMLAEGGPDLFQVMKSLGFSKEGKDFVHDKMKIYAEFPGRGLQPNERARKIKIGTRILRIISIEDLIVDRLCSFKFWQSAIDGLNAIKLLEIGVDDETRLDQRSGEEEVRDALVGVREIREEVIRKKLTADQANALLLKKMCALKGR
jgi:hypothetical protein